MMCRKNWKFYRSTAEQTSFLTIHHKKKKITSFINLPHEKKNAVFVSLFKKQILLIMGAENCIFLQSRIEKNANFVNQKWKNLEFYWPGFEKSQNLLVGLQICIEIWTEVLQIFVKSWMEKSQIAPYWFKFKIYTLSIKFITAKAFIYFFPISVLNQ